MTEVVHKDILGNMLKLGDSVVYPDHNRMKIGTVKKLTPKMVNVKEIGRHWSENPDRKYPQELLVVDDPKLTMYILKNSK